MTLHLGVVNGEIDTVDRAWDYFCDMLIMIRCPGVLGVGICTWLCIYAFVCVWFVCMMWRDVIWTWQSIVGRWTESAVVLWIFMIFSVFSG